MRITLKSILIIVCSPQGSSGIGNGAALALLEHGAHVTIVSSSQEKVNAVLQKINNPSLNGVVGNVKDEGQYTEVLKSLAPMDHLVYASESVSCFAKLRYRADWLLNVRYSSVDKIIRGRIAEADLKEASELFGMHPLIFD